MDVLFVVPSRGPQLHEEFGGTLLLATILKKQGLSVKIHRFYEVDHSGGFFDFVNQTASSVLSNAPKIVSFYCRCDCYLSNIMIAKRIKEEKPDTYIVFGGPQADASARDSLG